MTSHPDVPVIAHGNAHAHSDANVTLAARQHQATEAKKHDHDSPGVLFHRLLSFNPPTDVAPG